VSREQYQPPIPPSPSIRNGQVIEYIYGGLPGPPDLTRKEKKQQLDVGGGRLGSPKKLHIKKLEYFPLLFTF
jgi:hypothetical protein